jgi:hypothetical protein
LFLDSPRSDDINVNVRSRADDLLGAIQSSGYFAYLIGARPVRSASSI